MVMIHLPPPPPKQQTEALIASWDTPIDEAVHQAEEDIATRVHRLWRSANAQVAGRVGGRDADD